ncbi:hypothetical protein YTPLAS73_14550 [Nitrosarchaeum sp.]|nr:hypothetical protein YTPLAS73_14550 [Nitrosarchaeum sp.]
MTMLMRKSKFVGITIPKELYDKIESDRGDLPRSYVYKKLVLTGYENGALK